MGLSRKLFARIEMSSLHAFASNRQFEETNLIKDLMPLQITKKSIVDSPIYSTKFYNEMVISSTKNHDIILMNPDLEPISVYNSVYGRWTITDFDIHNDVLAHSSLSPIVHLQKLSKQEQLQPKLLDLKGDICTWSVKIRNNSILAGCTNGIIILHDIITNRNLMRIDGHDDDVNSVVFVDNNVFVSGSDDYLIKVWDVRTMGCAGYLVGHTQGITHVQSQDNNVLSNGKDQTMKMWDLRKLKDRVNPKTKIDCPPCIYINRGL